MASNTSRLGLLKKDPAADGNDTFNIKAMLNDNWDRIDENVAVLGPDGKVPADQLNVDTTNLATKQSVEDLSDALSEHQTEDATTTKKGHVQLSSSADSNSDAFATTPNAVRKKVDQSSLKMTKSNKDSNGIYTTVTYSRKSDGSKFATSVLSGGTSPQYTTRTVTYYGIDGTTVEKTDTFTLTYDADGDLLSEV